MLQIFFFFTGENTFAVARFYEDIIFTTIVEIILIKCIFHRIVIIRVYSSLRVKVFVFFF